MKFLVIVTKVNMIKCDFLIKFYLLMLHMINIGRPRMVFMEKGVYKISIIFH